MAEKQYIEIVARLVVEYKPLTFEHGEAANNFLMNTFAPMIVHDLEIAAKYQLPYAFWDSELLEKAVFVEKTNGDETTYEYVMTEPDAKYLK